MRRVNVDRMRRYNRRGRERWRVQSLGPLVMIAPPPPGNFSAHFTIREDGTMLDHRPYLRPASGNA